MKTMMKLTGPRKSHFVLPLALLQLLFVALFVFAAGTGGTYNLSLTNTATGVAIPIVSTTNGDYVTNYAVISLPESVTFTVAPPVNNNNFTVGFWDFNGAGNPSHISGNNTTVMSYFASTNTPIAITPVTLYSSRTDDASVLCTTAQQVLQLIPFKLVNLADPYQGSAVIGTPSHNDQDTTIDLNSTQPVTDINGVAWIAAGDASTGNAPRMPELVATLGAPSGTMVWWKLSVINHGLHGTNGNPYRDFDTGANLTGDQVAQLTNVNEWAGYSGPVGGMVGYSDDIAIPFPESSQDNGVENGWVPIPAGTPWNIYQDPDWLIAVAAGFFGGDAELSFKVTTSDGNTVILPEQDFYFRIAGENPPADPTTGVTAGAGSCQNYIFSTYGGPSSNWANLTFTPGLTPPTLPTVPGSSPPAPSYWFAYAIAKEETANNGGRTWYNQFLDNGGTYSTRVPGLEGYPNWNYDPSADPPGTGGYGLFQLTYEPKEPNFIMPRDWIWNWQSNVQQFLPIAQEKLQTAQRIVNRAYSHHPPPAFTDPSTFIAPELGTHFHFWEAAVITLYNGGFGWSFTAGTNGQAGTWVYTDFPPNYYLYNVTLKGIDNSP